MQVLLGIKRIFQKKKKIKNENRKTFNIIFKKISKENKIEGKILRIFEKKKRNKKVLLRIGEHMT
jgi:hypothetical protein